MTTISRLPGPSISFLEFERILNDEKEDPELRYRATLQVARFNPKNAISSLVKASNSNDPRVLNGVAKALGQIGDASALPVLDKIQTASSGALSQRAEFSAALIAHRHGLSGHDIKLDSKSLELPVKNVSAISLVASDKSETENALHSANRMFGITLDEKLAFTLTCAKRRLLVLLNRDFTNEKDSTVFLNRKSFPGIVTIKNEDGKSHSVAYLILSSPSRQSGSVNLIITRTNGDVVLTGQAKLVNNSFEFEVNAVERPGAYAIRLKGNFDKGTLAFYEAHSSLRAQVAKKTPIKMTDMR
jgi:hypothetical protein